MKSANKNYCKNHPDSETTWRCTECGSEFCESCVKPVESYFTKTAVCPECKGRCEDFKRGPITTYLAKHINLTGDYVWKQNRTVQKGNFRPLRQACQAGEIVGTTGPAWEKVRTMLGQKGEKVLIRNIKWCQRTWNSIHIEAEHQGIYLLE